MDEQQPVPETGGLLEGVGHHQRRELLVADELRGGLHDPVGGRRIEGGGVLVEEEDLGAVPGRHDERHNLPLPPRHRADRLVEALFESGLDGREPVGRLGPQPAWRGPAEPHRPAPGGGDGEVLEDRQARGRPGPRVLEHAPDIPGAPILAPRRELVAGDMDAAGVEADGAGDRPQERALPRAVGADDDDERPRRDREADVVDGADERSARGGEGDGGVADVEHGKRGSKKRISGLPRPVGDARGAGGRSAPRGRPAPWRP